MNRMRLQCRTVLFGVFAVAGVVAPVLLVILYAEWRRACREQEVVTALQSKISQGQLWVGRDIIPNWRNWLCEQLGIEKPVVSLALSGPEITDSDLTLLRDLQYLESLSIDSCPISDHGVEEIARLTRLRYVSFFGPVPITDASFESLANMTSLEELSIGGFLPRITGRNIEKLSVLPRLGTLSLVCCLGVSDEAVESLGCLKQLRTLDIRGTEISEEGVNRLERALPNTLVLTDY